MRHSGLISIMIFTALIVSFTFKAFAQEGSSPAKRNYVSLKGGIYVPMGDLDEADNGLFLDIMYNRYLSEGLAIEAGVGMYYWEAASSSVAAGLGSYRKTDTISVTPVMLNIKGIYPYPIFPFRNSEFYVGAGIGIYFAGAEADMVSAALGSFSVEDNDVVLGCQIKAGAIFNLSDVLFLGIEGIYMLTDSAEFSGVVSGVPITTETDFSGYSINGVFGFRF